MKNFRGSKIALLLGDKLIMYLRDDKPGLNFANMWDFFGGGREGNETPVECLIREVREEIQIELNPKSIIWQKEVSAMNHPDEIAYFFVARITQEEIELLRFGSEGQKWGFMSIEDFFKRDDVVPALKERFQSYLDSRSK